MSRSVLSLVAAAAVAVALLIAGVGLAAGASGTELEGPEGTTSDTTPTFTFSSSEAASFECRMDDGPWKPCSSPHTEQVDDGAHTFAVRAVDEAGNTDDSPATLRFTVDTGQVDTTIDAGPDGPTNDPTPSFTFGSPTTGATYECRIEGAFSPAPDWSACSSPLTLPALRSGEYAFAVRAISQQGRVDGSPARRAFTVDADPPDTEITEGPAAGQDAGTRTPAFRYASEPGARFECRMDNAVRKGIDTVAWADCPSAGYTASTLAGGQHTFEVRAVDPAGNVDRSPAQRAFRVSVCEKVVRFGVVEATGDCLKNVGTSDRPKYESEDDVNVNGLPVPAPGPTKVVVEGREDGSGKVSISNIVLRVAGVKLYEGSLGLDIPKGGPGDEVSVKDFDVSKLGEKIAGMKVTGLASLRLGRRSGDDGARYAVVGLKVELPEMFKTGPSPGAGGVTGEVAVRMDRQNPPKIDGLKIAVKNAYIGTLGVKSICVSYLRAGATFIAACEAPRIGPGEPKPYLECAQDANADRWDGSAQIILPTASQTELGFWAGLRDGRFSHGGAYVDRLGTTVPLATGVFLERVALGVCLEPPPFKIKGGVAVIFGPSYQGRGALRVDGDFQYTDSHGDQPWRIDADGRLQVFGFNALEAHLGYQPGLVDFRFAANLLYGPFTLKGKVDGWVETTEARRFSVSGDAQICLVDLACSGGRAVLSSVGAAGCIKVFGVTIPYPKVSVIPPGIKWKKKKVDVEAGAGLTWNPRDLDVMMTGCSIGRWEIARPASAFAAQAGGPAFTVEPGEAGVVIRVKGKGAPPRVALVAPDGRRIEPPTQGRGQIVQGSHAYAEDVTDGSTKIMLRTATPGQWRIEPVAGSPEIAAIQRAGIDPEPMVTAAVTGRGHRRTLHYALVKRPGQEVLFVERGPRTQRTLGTGARGHVPCPPQEGAPEGVELVCGRIAFRPHIGGAGPRRIEAVVSTDGLPVKNLEVATYVAPADALPARPRDLRIRRRGDAAIVSWRSGVGAIKDNVVVRTADGRRELVIRTSRTRRQSVRIPRLARRHGAVVAIRGMGVTAREGRPATARLKPAKPSKPRRVRRSK